MGSRLFPSSEEAARLTVGPGSISWSRAGDARAMLAAGSTLLLQVAHPTIAAGVRQHSDFERDPWGRLLRTLDFTTLLVYGGSERAVLTGRRLRAMHRSIKGVAPDGTRYHALEPAPYAWVHATLAEGIVAAHDRFGRPLDLAQRERLWAEWRGLGRLLGIRERDLPEGWAAFVAYREAMIAEQLGDNDVVRAVLRTLAAQEPPPVPGLGPRTWGALRLPAARTMRLATVGLLPPSARERLGLRWTGAQALELAALGRVARATTPLLPATARAFGPAYLRWRTGAIARGPFAPAAHGAASPAGSAAPAAGQAAAASG